MNGNNTIQIEINGEVYQGLAYQAGDSLRRMLRIRIHLPGLQASHAYPFDALFKALPQERLNGGNLEVGEWNGNAFPFESQLLFGLGPDGAVWAKVCDSPDDLPVSQDAPANLILAWRKLAEAEEAFGAQSMARERAACGSWPRPHSIQDYLMWIEDEAAVQEDQAPGSDSDEMIERMVYAAALSELAQELRALGFAPTPVPWEVEEGAA